MSSKRLFALAAIAIAAMGVVLVSAERAEATDPVKYYWHDRCAAPPMFGAVIKCVRLKVRWTNEGGYPYRHINVHNGTEEAACYPQMEMGSQVFLAPFWINGGNGNTNTGGFSMYFVVPAGCEMATHAQIDTGASKPTIAGPIPAAWTHDHFCIHVDGWDGETKKVACSTWPGEVDAGQYPVPLD